MSPAHHSTIPARLLARIEKIMALSGSPNEFEAAAAATKAQQLLFAHHLEAEDIGRLRGRRTSRDGQIVEQRYGELVGEHLANWQRSLAAAVAQTSFCALLNQRRWQPAPTGGVVEVTNLLLVGRADDVELAQRTLDFLSEVLLRLADTFVAEHAESGGPSGRGRQGMTGRRTAYLNGAADSVTRRLLAAFANRAGQSPSSRALVERREDELEAHLAARAAGKKPLPKAKRDRSSPDDEAYLVGYADGGNVPLSIPVPSLAPGDKLSE